MPSTLGGRYRLDTLIGGGGMGEVWSAHDSVLGRAVAVKVIREHLAEDENVRARLRIEARLAGSLHHPGIVDVFDYGEDEVDGRTVPFIVMPLIGGAPLSEVLRERRTLTTGETMAIVADVAGALQMAHEAGIVHRDLKPANILLTPSRRVMLVDFGIARSIDGEPLTQTGALIGTADYLSPEQAAGRTATHSSDLYSLGVVAYTCLTGTAPFHRDSDVATALAHIQAPMPELPEEVVASGVSPLIAALLAKDASERPASAADVESAARALATDVPIPGGASVPTELSPTMARTSSILPVAAEGATSVLGPAMTAQGTSTIVPVSAALGVEAMTLPPSSPTPTLAASGNTVQHSAPARRRPSGKVLGSVAVALVAIVLGWMLFTGSNQVQVPSLHGMTSNEAAVALKSAGLSMKSREVDAAGRRKGDVVTQSPAPGAKVDKPGVVEVSVATGYVTVPGDLVGMSYDDAAARLTKLGLKPSRTTVISTKTAGTVLGVSPSTRAESGAAIALKVAAAPQPPANSGSSSGKQGKGKGKKH